MAIKIDKHARLYPAKDDGFRLLVTRFWLRGLAKNTVSGWDRELAPSEQLLSQYRDQKAGEKSPEEQKNFHDRWRLEYRAEMLQKKHKIEALRTRHLDGETITLLCACHSPEFCHRKELKDLIENGWGECG